MPLIYSTTLQLLCSLEHCVFFTVVFLRRVLTHLPLTFQHLVPVTFQKLFCHMFMPHVLHEVLSSYFVLFALPLTLDTVFIDWFSLFCLQPMVSVLVLSLAVLVSLMGFSPSASLSNAHDPHDSVCGPFSFQALRLNAFTG